MPSKTKVLSKKKKTWERRELRQPSYPQYVLQAHRSDTKLHGYQLLNCLTQNHRGCQDTRHQNSCTFNSGFRVSAATSPKPESRKCTEGPLYASPKNILITATGRPRFHLREEDKSSSGLGFPALPLEQRQWPSNDPRMQETKQYLQRLQSAQSMNGFTGYCFQLIILECSGTKFLVSD